MCVCVCVCVGGGGRIDPKIQWKWAFSDQVLTTFFSAIVYEVRWKNENMSPHQLIKYYEEQKVNNTIIDKTNVSQCEKFCSYGRDWQRNSTFVCNYFVHYDSNTTGSIDKCILIHPIIGENVTEILKFNTIFVKLELNMDKLALRRVLKNDPMRFHRK